MACLGKTSTTQGCTVQAHIFSLGATLKAALEFVVEPGLEHQLSADLEVLLNRMLAEDPAARPCLEVSSERLSQGMCG